MVLKAAILKHYGVQSGILLVAKNITYIKGLERGNASVVMDGTNFLTVIEEDPFIVFSGSVVGK